MRTFVSVFIALLILNSHHSFSQNNQVYDRLTNSFESGIKSKEFAGLTLDMIRKCYALSTVEEIQEYAGKANTELDQAKAQIGFAILHAIKAEEEADEINCHLAEMQSSQAESNFISARSRFDDAFNFSLKAQKSENKEDFALHLGKARGFAEEGISYIEDALKDLNNAIEELKNCPSEKISG